MADLGNTSVLSPTDSSNGSGTMPSWLGSAAPSTLDDAGRALQGAVAREWENRSYPTATGTAPAFVVSYTVAPAALRSGQTYTFTAHAAAVGTDTLNANTLGAKGIKKVVAGVKTATAANDFYTGDKIACVYDGTDMVWVNSGSASLLKTNNLSDVSSAATAFANIKQAADESTTGVVELATDGEAQTGTATDKVLTPANLRAAAIGKRAVWIDAKDMTSRVTSGATFSTYDSGANDHSEYAADFDTTTQEYAHFKLVLPNVWNLGTVSFKAYWTATGGASTETVMWSLNAVSHSNGANLNNSTFGTAVTVSDEWIANNALHISDVSGDLTISNTPIDNDLLTFEVTRVVASDNMAGDARLFGIMLYYTVDTLNEP